MSPPVAVASPAAAPNSTYALVILSLINLVNYLDRYIVTVALPHIQRDFQLDNTQAGLLGSFFMVVFMLPRP